MSCHLGCPVSRNSSSYLFTELPLCKETLDSLEFWIPRHWFRISGTGFESMSLELGLGITVVSRIRIPWAVFCIPKPGIPDSTSKHFADSLTLGELNEWKKYSELNIRCIDWCLLIMAGDCLIHCTVWINAVIPTNRNKWTRIWRAALMPLAFSCAFILFIDTEFLCTKEAYRPWTSTSLFYDYVFITETGYFRYCCSLAKFRTCVTWQNALYLSVNVFSTQLLVEYTILTSPRGEWIRAISSWSYEPLNGLAIHKAAKSSSSICSYFKAEYWSAAGSNLRPPTLQSSALPTELILQRYIYS